MKSKKVKKIGFVESKEFLGLKKILKLFGLIILCEILGGIGAIFTTPNIPIWYASLTKPLFAPPNWVFFPVWTILFALMGIALFLVLENKEKKKVSQKKKALVAFGVQFFFNILWSFLFFGLRNPLYGLVGIFVLWLAIVFTIISFFKVSKTSSYLLVPYILWVSFAGILNAAIWMLN